MSALDEQQIIYVGKHGNDANDGLTIEKAKLTFGAAITAAGVISPASIVCFDGGTYTETLTLVANVNIDAKNAILTGSFDLVDDSHVTFMHVNVATGTTGILKSTGTGNAYANVEEIICVGTGGGCISNAGTIFLNFDYIEIEDGSGIGDFAATGVGINFDGREINTINAVANGIATGAPTLITGYVGTIVGGGRGINAVGSCRVIANQINTNLGVRANNADLEIFCNELIGTAAILLVGTAILNLHAIRVTGTIVTPGGTTYNFISAEDGINTKESFVGTTHSISNTNTDNTNTSSHAQIETIVGGAAGGDPFLHLDVTGAAERSFGIDNSDLDKLKITTGATPSAATTHWEMTTAGERTLPLQPSFYAWVNPTIDNVTGAGTQILIIFNNERFDIGGNFDTTTGVFTAPIAGTYIFHANVLIDDITAAMTGGQLRLFLNGAPRNVSTEGNPGIQRQIGPAVKDDLAFRLSTTLVLAASDTVDMRITLESGAGDTADISGLGGAGDDQSWFTGYLLG